MQQMLQDVTDISIHSLRMEGDYTVSLSGSFSIISIHSLRMEGDADAEAEARGEGISIHSLRMEGDSYFFIFFTSHSHFNPLPPHGGRPLSMLFAQKYAHFNPLPPHGGRPYFFIFFTSHSHFNPLPPHGGRPLGRCLGRFETYHFNPLPPHGGRHIVSHRSDLEIIFQSTPSAWRETQTASAIILARRHFNPLPPHGGRPTTRSITISRFPIFQSTPSAWRETAKLHRKAFFISPILVQSCKKGCKRLHSAPEKMVFFEKREKNLVRNLQHLSVRL